ncbi:hypothetical protein K492DRAFT_236801 [Lichtheimia hyalospora FSU 10163]|nr:hypothetical protein K492DRAFT_236801 [Lichtheimia hyalospora FSU 10163]
MLDFDKLKQRPISVFHIPLELLNDLRPTDYNASETPSSVDLTTNKLEQLELEQSTKEQEDGSLTCRTCNITFPPTDRQEHRAHFATDWHRYNIKRKLTLGLEPVNATDFENMLADIAESISGSESEETDEEDQEKEDDVKDLVTKQQAQVEASAMIQDDQQSQTVLSSFEKKTQALAWFQANTLSPSVHFGIYRRLTESLDGLKQLQNAPKSRLWTIIMVGGGHFAAGVVDVNKSLQYGMQYGGLDVNQVKMVAHKTFHRYTTRRKQGGSQSANDNAKGAANSAGAMIRRYNEQMLQQEIRELLSQWKDYINTSEQVLVHAPSNNRKIVYGYEGATLTRDNSSTIPFSTRRPTLNEVRRVFIEMTTLKITQVDVDAIQSQRQKAADKQERARQQLEKSRLMDNNKKTAEKPKMAPEVEKLISLTRQGKEQVVLAHVRKHEELLLPITRGKLTPQIVPEQEEILRRFPSILHLAAHGAHAGLVSVLLRDIQVDPTVENDLGKTAYEVAREKDTRNAFRRCMYDLPNMCDWLNAARVPSPLSPEAELEILERDKERKERELERRRMIEQERRKRDDERIQQEEAKAAALRQQRQKSHATNTGARTLGGGNNVRTTEMNMANMTPEARMRLEREMRARAAEERMRRLQGK